MSLHQLEFQYMQPIPKNVLDKKMIIVLRLVALDERAPCLKHGGSCI